MPIVDALRRADFKCSDFAQNLPRLCTVQRPAESKSESESEPEPEPESECKSVVVSRNQRPVRSVRSVPVRGWFDLATSSRSNGGGAPLTPVSTGSISRR